MKHTVILILMSAILHLTTLPAPETREIQLEGGPPVIFEQNPYAELTVIHLLIRGGKSAEPATLSGLAYLTTRLAIEVHDPGDQRKMVEMASRFDFKVEPDYCRITITCLSPHLRDTLDIFIRFFCQPLFSGLRINRIKQHALHLQKSELDQDISLMNLTLQKHCLSSAGTPGSIYGDAESLDRIGRHDIDDFYRRYFCRNNMCIAASSNLTETEMTDVLSATIARIPAGERSIPKIRNLTFPEKRIFSFPLDRNQVLVSFAFCIPELSPENFHQTFLLENLLGKGIGSLLWPLREEERLAYMVYAEAIQLRDAGFLLVYLKTERSREQIARKKLEEILTNLAEKEFSQPELSAHKHHARADFYRINESGERRVLTLALFELLGPGVQYAAGIPVAIEQLSPETFNRFKKTVLRVENRVEILIGGDRDDAAASL